jgi:cyclopropane fatty-acyl-phospholipid synthase-like methyltransferase
VVNGRDSRAQSHGGSTSLVSAASSTSAGPAIVARYYDDVQWLYNLGWSPGGTHSLHYGLWWDDTRSLAQAIVNGDRFIGEKLGVLASDHVLDMGCGVGGTSVFLAETFGCRVTGITISPVQRAQATAYAQKRGVGDRVRFELMDYTAMRFPDGTFTKAFTQETSNHALDKHALLREALRVLVPGGRYASLDAFEKRPARSGDEDVRYRRVLNGWPGGDLVSLDRFVAIAKEVGLEIVAQGDVTERTTKSAHIIWRRHVVLFPFVRLARALRLVSPELVRHFEASIEQKDMFGAKDNVLMYGYFVASKPGG